jgi:hypothetical protein
VKIRAFHHQALLLVFLISTSFLYAIDSNNNIEKSNQQEQVWLNVYVHGIISIKPHITVSNFILFLTDNVCDSIYSETVTQMRDSPFFFQNQAMQHRGLRQINLDDHKKGASASAMANIFEMNNQINPLVPTKNYYYTYGWSGLLSRSARYNDAREFFYELEEEVAKFHAQGINPKVRLLGYSHGGTIILKLGMVKQKENLQPHFNIDEAFLFGTPIQFDTDLYINDPIFKKVYNIYSRGDRVQQLDFFSCGEFFSDRIFKNHCDFVVPDKLVQIEIRVIRKKGEACKPIVADVQPCRLLYDGKTCSRNLRNVSPGHTELWFFGWTPMHYRHTFPLYPLPIVAFVPFIINSIKPLERNFKPEMPITVTIDPRRNSMIVNNNLRCPQVYRLPFVGIENLIALKELALQFKPDTALFNKEVYDEQIKQAYDEAMISLREKKCQQKIEAKLACDKN